MSEAEGKALAKKVVLDMLAAPEHTDQLIEIAEGYVESRSEYFACKREIKRLVKLLHEALKRGEGSLVLVRTS